MHVVLTAFSIYYDVIFDMYYIGTVLYYFSNLPLNFATCGTSPHYHTLIPINSPGCSKRVQLPRRFLNLELIVAIRHIQLGKSVCSSKFVTKLCTGWYRLMSGNDKLIYPLAI